MDASGAPGATQSLSSAQFSTAAIPTAHGAEPIEPRPQAPAGSLPLSSMASTFGSVKEAATWRKPGSVLPINKATLGSTFNPFGQ